MAYSNPLDPTTPSAIALRSEGDDRIREIKAALIERLLTVFQDLDADPLQFILGVIPAAAIANDLIITTAKLADGAVTTPKVGDGAVTELKLADDAVSFAKLLPALSAKMVQRRTAIVSLASATVYAAGSVTDVSTGLSVSAGTFNHAVGISSLESSFPSASLKLSFVQNASTGAISLRIHNSSAGAVTLSALYSVGVWIIEPLS